MTMVRRQNPASPRWPVGPAHPPVEHEPRHGRRPVRHVAVTDPLIRIMLVSIVWTEHNLLTTLRCYCRK